MPIDKPYEEMRSTVMTAVSKHFRPEFINRIDETVVFHSLSNKDIEHIAQIQLDILCRRLEEKGYQLHVSQEVLSLVCEAGFDPVYGARPLKRSVQHNLENPLAQQLLKGALLPGIIKAELQEGLIHFISEPENQ